MVLAGNDVIPIDKCLNLYLDMLLINALHEEYINWMRQDSVTTGLENLSIFKFPVKFPERRSQDNLIWYEVLTFWWIQTRT